MKRRLCATLALCLLLAGCGPGSEPEITHTSDPTAIPEVTATPAPEPSAPTLPDPRTDPTGYVLACLDWAMEGEQVFMRFWLHSGSGPNPEYLPVSDYGHALRQLFSDLDWSVTEPPSYDDAAAAKDAPFNQPGAYSVSIYYGDPGAGYLGLRTDDPVIMLGDNGPDSVYLCADGAEELCDKLTDMVPSVYLNLGRTRVPPQESEKATLKLYLDTALARTKELGHVTDYELRDYAVITWSEEDGYTEKEGSGAEDDEARGSFAYTATYAFKPAHPELAYWQTGVLDADGWVEGTIEPGTDFLLYDERDGCYGMY